MMDSAPMRWLGSMSVRSKFAIVVVSVAFVVLFSVFNFWLATNLMSDIRAYVGGEGLWSKAEKAASSQLNRYGETLNEMYYDNFTADLHVPLGDKAARLELEKNQYNRAVAVQGFLDGGNNPEDIPGLIFLFRYFGNISYMRSAIIIWVQGDEKIAELYNVAADMHTLVLTQRSPGTALPNAVFLSKMAALEQQNEQLDMQLSQLENDFSATLGEGSRKISRFLLLTFIFLDLALAGMVMYVLFLVADVISRADTAKSEFVALASHQLRTPLTVIRWAAEDLVAMRGALAGEDERKHFVQILDAATEMSALVHTILTTSRVELGALLLHVEKMDIIALAKEETQHVSITAKKIGVSIHEEYPSQALMTSVDKDLFKIVLQNLLTNAIRYSLSGGIVTTSIWEEKGKIIISVADTGVGIPEDAKPKIFTKLFRASNTKAAGEGSGLGLYLVKSIVEKTGGSINFESVENSGTTFTVTYPKQGMRAKGPSITLQ